ncbi:MAG TPA: amylo-alpha-1,6-glucosidase [Thermoanaerobaculia bacterium]|jgi:glycogen debranching enzyme|nr:amylo-alpha-1,6-glucosidase [Thermoanaerobaculia bacterium]
MEEIIQVKEQYYILATNSRTEDRTRVLKHGESFGVFDRSGAIRPVGLGEMGLFHEGTRFLSAFELFLENQRPLLLSSTVRSDNALIVDLTNPDFTNGPPGESEPLARDTVHIFSTSFLWCGAWYARLRLHNYGLRALDLHAALRFAADYADIFEIRGVRRDRRGHRLDPVVGRGTVVLGYEGLDGRVRRTRLVFSPTPAELTDSLASFRVHLPPRGEQTLDVTAAFESGREAPNVVGFVKALEKSVAEVEVRQSCRAAIETSDQRFNEWLERSSSDLQMMVTETPHGLYPYAGVPWFSTVFGRDGILTAYETLWLDPTLARGVLAFLAATQAREVDPEKDAEPGKIIHEMRKGEMAALGEVPFSCYYGTVDATPLFVVLAGAYWRRTGDRAFIESIWSNVERALSWIDEYGDLDGDGFVEYSRRSKDGLVSQGWKDSVDSIFHRDGTLAEGPIALCEVQGYVYAARRQAAELARALGHAERAEALERQAEELRENFERAFWCEEISIYCPALDGRKQRCQVRASNAGHCLFAGIASPPRAWRVAHTLLNESFFSGWGIRTLEANEVRYNPMSYHNGSVWPHDNAIIAAGMARYGRKDGASKVLSGLFDASLHFDLHRMPELFCGFRQRSHEGPTLYPVACAPQAWAAGSVFLLLQACLGLDIEAPKNRICLNGPELPAGLRNLTLRNLRVGGAKVDLVFQRYEKDVATHLENREGDVEVVVVK